MKLKSKRYVDEPLTLILGLGLLMLMMFTLGYIAGWYGWLHFTIY